MIEYKFRIRTYGLILFLAITLSGLAMGTILAVMVETVLRWFGV